MRRWAIASALGIGVATSFAHSIAHAMPSARFVYLRGQGTESCPAESEVREAVQVRLGYDPFSSYAASTMFAEVTTVSGGFSANLKLVDGANVVRGDRVLRVQGRCAELIDAMALTISIAIDPMSVNRNGPPDDAPPTEKLVDPTVQSTPDPEPSDATPTETAAPPPATPETLRLSAGLGPLVSLGSAPALALGGVVFVEGRYGLLLAGLEGRGDLPSSASAGAPARVESSLLAGSLTVGAREGSIFACAVGSLGRFVATSSNVAEAREREALFLAAGLRLGLAIPLSSRLEVVGRVEALANLRRHTLDISDRQVYRFPVATGSASVAMTARSW